MITPELIAYIKNQHKQGIEHEQIVAALRANGWMEDDITNAFNMAIPQPVVTPAAVIPPVQETIQQPIQAEPVQPMMAQFFVQPVITQQPVQTFQVETQQPFSQVNSTQSMPIQTYNTMTGSQMDVRKKSRTPLIVGIIAILMLLVGGLSYAYYAGYFTPLEKTAAQAFESIYSAKTASFDITTTLDVSNISKTTTTDLATLTGGLPLTKVSVTTKGVYDLSRVDDEKISTTISAQAGGLNIEGDVRYVGKTVYAQITKMPTIALIPMLSSFANQWIMFPATANTDSLSGTPLAGFIGIDSSFVSRLTAEQKKHLYDLARNAQFITITKKESPEEINGKLAYHFEFTLNKKGISEYLKQAESYIHEIGKNDSKLSSFSVASYISSLDSVENFTGEAWIGKTDKLLAKTNINFSIITSTNNEQSTVNVGIIGLFDKWNEPVTVVAPDSSKTIDQITKEMIANIEDGTSSDPMIQASLDEASKKADEAKRKSLVTNQRSFAELYFSKNKSYTGFCNSKDYPQPDGIACVSVKNGFLAFTDLENGKFFCADATGFAGEVSTEPKTGSTCPKK